ncbi:MAG: hypothetical protein WD489_01960, partial [Rhodovibrionaceae bacterium]
SLAQAKAALAPGVPVLLLSAEGAAGAAGPAWWREVIALARAAHPATDARDLLDCGAAPGAVMAALAAGITELSFHGSAAEVVKLTQMGATLLPRPAEALDLAEAPQPEHACRVWLLAPQPGD